MRKTVLSAAVTAVLVLSACSADEAEPAQSPAAEEVEAQSTALDDVTVSGEVGSEPEVEFEAPLVIEEPDSTVVSEGEGETVEEGVQVTAHMTLVSGASGEVIESSYESEAPSGFPTDTAQINQGLFDAVVGQRVGSRVLLALNGPAQSGSQPETLLYVVDIEGVEDIPEPLERAEGQEQELPEGLPAVTRGENGAPALEQPSGEPPAELETAYTIEGTGPEVEEGQNVTVHYTGWLWDDASEPFDSSWERGEPYPVQNVGQAPVIDGWNEGLVGQKVGSQIVLVVPPDKGYGAQGQGEIPGDATLVFVIDILAVVG